MARSKEDITSDLEALATTMDGVKGHRLTQLVAELRGEPAAVAPTPNAVREAEAAQQHAEALKEEAKAATAAAKVAAKNA